jgi:tetratricopeptide (TPR) repeat protein
MTISNFPTAENRSSGYLDLLFPVGLIMAVREPTLTRTNVAQLLHPVIRVDSPSDIVFLQPQNQLVQDVKWKSDIHVEKSFDTSLHTGGWKALGNRYFNAEQWLPAAIAYSKGVEADPAVYLLRLNRAEAYLRLGYYTAALADVNHVLALSSLANPHRIKALSRAAKANYGRGDYAASERRYKEWADFATLNKAEALAGIRSAQARLKESITGQYDWTRLFKESQSTFRVDVADYVGPVKVATLAHRGGGRGVVATKNISFGDILVCLTSNRDMYLITTHFSKVVSKPFVSVFPQDLPADEDLRAFDLRSKKFTTRCQAALVTRVIEKLYGNPDQYDNVSSLYCGPGVNPPPSYPPVHGKEIQSVSPLVPSLDIDVGKIEAICTFNNFTPNSLEIEPCNTDAEQATALYLFPSLFNHACAANAVWRCIGDVMVIRATTNIASGNEVTIPYVCSDSYYERQAALGVYISPECDCILCREDREDGEEAVKRRETLLAEFSRSDVAQISLAEARRLAEKLTATYSLTRGSVRPHMSIARNLIAVSLHELAYDASGQLRETYFEEAIGEQIMALECVGMKVTDKTIRGAIRQTALPVSTSCIPTFTPHEQCIFHMISIAYSFHILNDRQRTIRWIKAAAWG